MTKEKLIQRIKEINTKMLLEVTKGLYFKGSEADLALGFCFNELELRLSDNQFIDFCNELYEA
jgi:hypothetical protein